jgi:hypothetical protein
MIAGSVATVASKTNAPSRLWTTQIAVLVAASVPAAGTASSHQASTLAPPSSVSKSDTASDLLSLPAARSKRRA